MSRIVNTFAFLLLSFGLHAQSDSVSWVIYTPDFAFNDGIYLNFEQVKRNNPIPKTRIICSEQLTSPIFFDKILDGRKLFFYDEHGLRKEVLTEKVWGFSSNGIIYINIGGSFNKISIVGNLCHFIATVTVMSQQYYDPFYYGYGGYYGTSPTTYAVPETRQFLLNFKTGEVTDYTYENVISAIASDKELSNEYASLSKRKKKDLKFLYIRKYNQRNPLFIPIKKRNKNNNKNHTL